MHWLRIVIYSVVVLVAAAMFAASEIWPERADLWLNLFAEALGVAFIVLVVENLIRIAEQRRSKPARYAAFKETLLIYNRLVALWFQLVQATYRGERHGRLLDDPKIRLLDPKFGEIVQLLRLDDDAPMRPKRRWRFFLSQQIEDVEKIIDRCLLRYSAFMDPEMIQCLQSLERTSFFSYGKILTSLPEIAQEMGVRQSPFFSWGGKSSAEELITPLIRLGDLLARHRSAFHGMPGIPETIDQEHRAQIESLRNASRPPEAEPRENGSPETATAG